LKAQVFGGNDGRSDGRHGAVEIARSAAAATD